MAQADGPRKLKHGNSFNFRVYDETQSGEEGEEDIELSLGLSLNGRFGVDPRANKKLCRSSSIPDFLTPTRENGTAFALPFMSSSNLVRTSSLPTETDEQWRQRKEMQMLRRMEAKRKRSEKQRNMKAVKDRIRDLGEDSCDESKKENGSTSHNQNSNGSFGAGSEEGLLPKSKAPSSQGSIGSQRSASGTSESESNPLQGMNKCSIEARSPVSVQSLSECEQKYTVTPNSTTDRKSQSPLTSTMENSGSIKPTVTNGAKETKKNMLEDMPCVSTKGDGPNGRRIEGFLYQYKKGEEVRIVCVCHGSFLSPAEFVKHAGGGDVAHPLKHIVVNPYPVL
ncbi:ninja-family protein AFP3-like [Euphorbia lathyris]|uniref:ninja-family protein AFP3-like n=1 Tax=Euphorbia lathyris TaxID=212925 RepID=UPI0033134804